MTDPVIHLLHGIHTSPTSRRLADLAPYVAKASGLKTVYHEYGDILALQTRFLNPGIARRLLPEIAPGDILVGHSNGNAIWLRALMLGAPAQGFVLLNAALKDDTDFAKLAPQLKWFDVYYNAHDDAVPWATASKWLLLLDPLWGDMGRDGYSGKDPRGRKFDCGSTLGLPRLSGHGAIITPPEAVEWATTWGKRIAIRQ